MEKIQTIYFYESGFTGNNLLNIDQPAFVYASVAIDPAQASAIHSELISSYRLDGNELKGKSLVRHKRGRDAISWLLDECKEYARISVSNKKYALAGKFFEYVFEPVLSSNNGLFYSTGFHKYIATIMYILFESRDAHAEEILREFEALTRTKASYHLEKLLSPLNQDISLSDPLGQIITFTLCHRERIAAEVAKLKGMDGLSNDFPILASLLLGRKI